MEIFIIIAAVVIILILRGINSNISDLGNALEEIRKMATMSDKQRYKYNLKKDDPDSYDDYIVGESYREQEAEKKKAEREKGFEEMSERLSKK